MAHPTAKPTGPNFRMRRRLEPQLDHHLVATPSISNVSDSRAVKMSDNGEVEVEVPTNSYPVLPKDVTSEIGSIKLFNKWSYEDVEIRDISLTYVERVEFL